MVVRYDEPTPHGGAYSMGYYTNDNGDDCNIEEATVVHIHEYTATGELICETIGRLD